MYHSPTYRLKVYRNFKSLRSNDYYGIVRYFEQHEEALYALELESYLDCALAYTTALFETNDWGRHNVMCDHLLQLIMAESIYTWGGEDLFTELLYKKALALSRSEAHQEAVHVLKQLRRIAPEHPETRQLLIQTLRIMMPPVRRRVRAIALLLLLLSAISTGITGIVIQPFFEAYSQLSVFLSAGLFGIGITTLIGGEWWYLRRCTVLADRPHLIIQ
jgi:hypothetical protein